MLACSAQGTLPHRITEDMMYDDGPGDFDSWRMQFTAPWDMNRAPTLTLPNGWSDEGLPMALQLVGPLGSEAALCQAGLCLRAGDRLHASPGGVSGARRGGRRRAPTCYADHATQPWSCDRYGVQAVDQHGA